MAQDFKVTISGDESVSEAANRASQGLGSLVDGVSRVNSAFQAFVGYEVLKKLDEELNMCVEAFAENEKAAISLGAAIAASTNVNQSADEVLQQYAEDLSKLTGYTKAQIEQMETYLITSGRTKDETKELLSVASDLAVAEGVDLNTAVQQLNSTFDGQAGRLAKMFPQLKELTKAQLENGDAIKIVEDRVKGQSQALENSTDVSLKNYNNAWKELFSSIGQGVSSVFTPLRNEITTIVDNVTKNIEAVNKLHEAYQHMNDDNKLVALNSQLTIMENKLLDLQSLKDLNLNEMGLRNQNDFVATHPDTEGTKTRDQQQQDYIRALDQYLKLYFSKEADLYTKIGSLTDQIKAMNTKAETPQKAGGSGSKGSINTRSSADNDDARDYMQEASDRVAKILDEQYRLELEEKMKEEAEWDRQRKQYEDGNEKMVEELQEMAKQIHQDSLDGKNGLIACINANLGDSLKDTDIGKVSSGIQDAEAAAQGSAGGPWGVIIALVIQKIGPLLNALSSFNQIADFTTTTFNGLMNVLGPLINAILKPLAGTFAILGDALGKVLAPLISAVLIPITTFLCDGFLWLFNYGIRPLCNGLIWAFNALYDGVAFVWNAIAGAINACLGWLGVHLDKMSTKSLTSGMISAVSMSDLSNASDSSSGTTGTSASYTQAPTYYNYWYFQPQVMVGDGCWDDFVRSVTIRAKQLGLS